MTADEKVKELLDRSENIIMNLKLRDVPTMRVEIAKMLQVQEHYWSLDPMVTGKTADEIKISKEKYDEWVKAFEELKK